jgi:hypothetical protein
MSVGTEIEKGVLMVFPLAVLLGVSIQRARKFRAHQRANEHLNSSEAKIGSDERV